MARTKQTAQQKQGESEREETTENYEEVKGEIQLSTDLVLHYCYISCYDDRFSSIKAEDIVN